LYDVGQVLYLLLSKSKKIAPVQVVEQIVRKSIEGEQVSYMVRLPNKENSKMLLSKIDCEVFTSCDSIRGTMIKNATDAIDHLVSGSREIAKSVFGDEPIEDIFNTHSSSEKVNDQDEHEDLVTVDLGDGLKGKINISSIGQVI